MNRQEEIVVQPADDNQDVVYVGKYFAQHPEESRDSLATVDSGYGDDDVIVAPPPSVYRAAVSGQRRVDQYFQTTAKLVNARAGQKRDNSTEKTTSAAKKTKQPSIREKFVRVDVTNSVEAGIQRIVRLAAQNGRVFNAEHLLFLKKLLEGGHLSLEGKPGTAKTTTLAFALDELSDTWIFSNAGLAADNLLSCYAAQRGINIERARFNLQQKNIYIKNYDGFFAILPIYRSYEDWERCTMKPVLANLLTLYRNPPKRIIFEEACNISSAKYEMLNRITNRMAKEVHEERIRMGAKKTSYIARYMACDYVCFFGDPRQIVPIDPITGEPDRLMDSSAFNELIYRDNNLAFTRILRQPDPVFQRVVDLIGDGEINDDVQLFVRSLRVISNPGPDDGVIICPYRAQVRQFNNTIIDRINVTSSEADNLLVRSYVPTCQYDSLADTRIRKRTTQHTDNPEQVIQDYKPNWVDVTPETNLNLYRRIMLEGDAYYDTDSKRAEIAELSKPIRLKFGTVCIYGTNEKRIDHFVNGTRVIIVGWKKNMPVVSLEHTALAYKDAHGHFGYSPDTLQTKETVVVKFTTTRFRVTLPKTPATATSPAVPGKTYSCKKIQMKLRPAYAFTAHKVQGKTLEKTVIDANPSRQFTPGLLFVALTRSTHPPALLEPVGPNFTVNVDRKAIAQCKEIEKRMKELCEENGIEWDLD